MKTKKKGLLGTHEGNLSNPAEIRKHQKVVGVLRLVGHEVGVARCTAKGEFRERQKAVGSACRQRHRVASRRSRDGSREKDDIALAHRRTLVGGALCAYVGSRSSEFF